MVVIAMLESGGAGAQPVSQPVSQSILPLPTQNPQSIDFSTDPLIRFLHHQDLSGEFQTAVRDAVVRHPTVSSAEATADEAQARRAEVRSALFPRLDAQLVVGRTLARDFGANTAIVESLQPSRRSDVSVRGDQLLWDFGATGRRISGATAALRSAEAESQRVATATTLRAVAAWYDVLMFQALGAMLGANVTRLQAITEDTRTRQASGLGSGGDVARAEAGLADAIGRAARVDRALADARARFGEAFGAGPPAHLPWPASPDSAATTTETAVQMSHVTPATISAEARAEAAKAEARAVSADRLPRLSVGVTATRYDVFQRNRDYDVRGQFVLRQTFSLGGAEAARASQARARARAAHFDEDQAKAEAERDATAALADSQLLDRNLAALEDAYRANRRARDVTVEQFRLSRGSLLDVLRVEQDFVAAASAYLQGAVERDVARYTLLARTGEILPAFEIEIPEGGKP